MGWKGRGAAEAAAGLAGVVVIVGTVGQNRLSSPNPTVVNTVKMK
jgi:hypothetical protein